MRVFCSASDDETVTLKVVLPIETPLTKKSRRTKSHQGPEPQPRNPPREGAIVVLKRGDDVVHHTCPLLPDKVAKKAFKRHQAQQRQENKHDEQDGMTDQAAVAMEGQTRTQCLSATLVLFSQFRPFPPQVFCLVRLSSVVQC